MRLGELLLASGLISGRELDAARAHQRVTGRRLGTTLIELGLLDADDVARALARQHGVPAALARHLRERDRGVVAYLPADTALELCALPVALSRGPEGINLVVCFRDPHPDIIAEVSRVAGVPVIPAVAAERLLERELLHSYPSPPAAQIKTPPLGSALPTHGLPARAAAAGGTGSATAGTGVAPRSAVAAPSTLTTAPMAAVAPTRTTAPMAAVAPAARATAPMAAVPRPVDGEDEDGGSIDVDVEDDDHGFGGLDRLALVDLDDKRVSRDHSQSLQLPARDAGQSGRMPQARASTEPARAAIPPSSTSGRYPAVTADGVPRIVSADGPPRTSTADRVSHVAARPAPEPAAPAPRTSTADRVSRVTAPPPPEPAAPAPRTSTADRVSRVTAPPPPEPAAPAPRTSTADRVSRVTAPPPPEPAAPAPRTSTADRVSRVTAPPPPEPAAPAPRTSTADRVSRVTAPPPPEPAAPAPRTSTADRVSRVTAPPPPASAAPAAPAAPTVAADESPTEPRPSTASPPSPASAASAPAGPASPTTASPPAATSGSGTAPGVPRITRTSVEGAALCTGERDPVAERYLPHLITSWRIAVVLAVEHGVAAARTGVGNALTGAALESVIISLANPSILRGVIDARRPHVGDALARGGGPREPWLQALLDGDARELAVAPVIVDDRVVRVVVAVGARLEIGAAAGEVIRVARMMIEAYNRGGDGRT